MDTPETKLLKELSYYDSDNEFMKRFYKMDEISERIELLFGKDLLTHRYPPLTADVGA